jgi:hypothetical protein
MASSTPKTQHSHNNRSSEWTSEMRDKQARGKNPYSEDSDASDTEPMRLGGHRIAESHMERERRGEAMFVLDNPEALMAHAQASGDVSCFPTHERKSAKDTYYRASLDNAFASCVNYAASTMTSVRTLLLLLLQLGTRNGE